MRHARGDTDATVVCSTPTYALRMAQEAQALGIDLAAAPVQRLMLSGEPAGSIPATKALIEEQWGAKAADTAGMTEVGTIIMFECDHQPGGAHIIEDHYLEEVIDPESGEPVGYGERGRARRHLLRARLHPRAALPDAGSRVPRARRSLQLRADLRHLRRRHPRPRRRHEGRPRHEHLPAARSRRSSGGAAEIDEFQIRLYTAGGIRDEIEVLVECADGDGGRGAPHRAQPRAGRGARGPAHRRPARPSASRLPRFELKAKRLVDEREVWGGKGDRKVM